MDFTGSNRAEAQRWLTIAEKLLAARDLFGTKSFAFRARESDPIVLEAADRVIAVADTLIAGETRINGQHDWYSILQLPRPTHSIELIASQFRRLALLLNPERSRIPFADQAFKLISDAWSVLSNPSKKALYDNEFNVQSRPGSGINDFFTTPQKHHQQQNQNQPVRRSPRNKDDKLIVEEERQTSVSTNATESVRKTRQNLESTRPLPFSPPAESTRPAPSPSQPARLVPPPAEPTRPVPPAAEPARPVPSPAEPARPVPPPVKPAKQTEHNVPSFWTACPYCYILYEYPKIYEECVLKCQNCLRAFQALVVPAPPVTEKDKYFCCWGVFPLGVSANAKQKGCSPSWMPFSPIFACPKRKSNAGGQKSGPRFYYDDDDVYVEVSDQGDTSDEDWGSERRGKRAKKAAPAPVANNSVKRALSERVNNKKVGDQANVVEDNVNLNGNVSGHFSGGSGVGGGVDLTNVTKGEQSSKKVAAASRVKKHRGKGVMELGKLDLNVEFSNEVEEAAPRGVGGANGTGHREDDNIEGIEFFEGLDEFLSSLPILNAVTDDKVKAS